MNGKKKMRWAELLALGTLVILGCNSTEVPDSSEIMSIEVPSSGNADAVLTAAPQTPIALETVDRARFEYVLSAQRGQVVLVDFWATWCGPCTKEFPKTVEMARKYRDRGLVVISVSLDDEENRATVEQFLHQQGATFPNLLSQYGLDDRSFEEFRIEGGAIPHYKLFDRQGNEIHSFVSGDPTAPPFTYDDIESAIQRALEGA